MLLWGGGGTSCSAAYVKRLLLFYVWLSNDAALYVQKPRPPLTPAWLQQLLNISAPCARHPLFIFHEMQEEMFGFI